MIPMPYSVKNMFLNRWKTHVHFIMFTTSVLKFTTKILRIVCNRHESFCVSLYTDYLIDLRKKIQVVFPYDFCFKYQVWTSCYNLFSSTAQPLKTSFRIEEASYRIVQAEGQFRKFDQLLLLTTRTFRK